MSKLCVGIGAGPANLSLACQLFEEVGDQAVFLDRQSKYQWHPGMQFDFAKLQVSHFKDLVTLVNPRSFFTFINFLHEEGRLYHFLNARFPDILRSEFEGYLQWCVENNPTVQLGSHVEDIAFDGDFRVAHDGGALRCKNLSIGIGRVPSIPDAFRGLRGDAVVHSSDFGTRRPKTAGKRVCIIGGGQSGAEIALDILCGSAPQGLPAALTWISRRDNFLPIDDTPFTNEYFMPGFSEAFTKLDSARKSAFIERSVLASDGISGQTVLDLYQAIYKRRYVDKHPCTIQLLARSDVEQASILADGVRLTTRKRGTGKAEAFEADVVILATGYRNADLPFMEKFAGRLQMNGAEYAIANDFSVEWDGPSDRKIFLQNASLRQRGLADPNLSLLAWRSRRILNSILGRPLVDQSILPSFVDLDEDIAPDSLLKVS